MSPVWGTVSEVQTGSCLGCGTPQTPSGGASGPVLAAAGPSRLGGLECKPWETLRDPPTRGHNSSLYSWEMHMECHQTTFHLPFGETGQRRGWAEKTWIKSDASSR